MAMPRMAPPNQALSNQLKAWLRKLDVYLVIEPKGERAGLDRFACRAFLAPERDVVVDCTLHLAATCGLLVDDQGRIHVEMEVERSWTQEAVHSHLVRCLQTIESDATALTP